MGNFGEPVHLQLPGGKIACGAEHRDARPVPILACCTNYEAGVTCEACRSAAGMPPPSVISPDPAPADGDSSPAPSTGTGSAAGPMARARGILRPGGSGRPAARGAAAERYLFRGVDKRGHACTGALGAESPAIFAERCARSGWQSLAVHTAASRIVAAIEAEAGTGRRVWWAES